MPAWNAAKTIGASVKSVISQTFTDWELIIINDASTDNTLSQIPADPRITVLTNEKNLGISQTRNRAIKHAKGEYLAFLDSDDMWTADKLEKQLNFMHETGALISYTSTSYMNAEGEMYSYILRAEKEFSYNDLLKRNLMSLSSVMLRRDLLSGIETSNPFPDGYMHEDYALWLKLLCKHGFAYGLDEALLIYRIAAGTKSSRRMASALMCYNAYRHVDYGWMKAGLLMLVYSFHSISKRIRIKKK